MKVLYLTADGAKLIKRGETLLFIKENKDYHRIFPHQTEQIYIIGNVNITTSALKLLMKHRIDTILIAKNGKFYGKLTFNPSKNVFLRIKQYKLMDKNWFSLSISKTIVKAKIKNQLVFLQKLNRKRNLSKIQDSIDKLKSYLFSIEKVNTVPKVRGIEGIASKTYFSVFRHAFIPEFAVFKRRSKNPPEDNVNAVLSFIYTLLYFRVDSYIEAEGLDSYAGYLHSLDYGRKSLAFDLLEEYRTPLGDTLTVSLFNLGILNREDFRDVIFSSENEEYPIESEEENEENIVIKKRGVLLNNDGLKKVINQFEKRLNTEYFYVPEGRRIFYKELIHYQVKHFKRIILGEEKEYKPLTIK
jgi:CRISPR-associated protein Cas1